MAKKDYAIKVKNLSKTFYVHEKGSRSIRDSILRFYQQKGELRKIEALNGINFVVPKGEFFGIIGRNGSGKSTLLRLLMGSFKSDAGSSIKSNGKMIRLAMGLGFDGNLSARDNIYINGSVLGLSFKKIGTLFDEIIEFAEIQNFIDTPVKHFSSGMTAKLKFSIARFAEADILLMDELFGGVGDIAFAHKSQKVFKENLLKGKTIILVSHSLNIIANNCDRVLLLDKGNQITIGTPDQVIPIYEEMFEEELRERNEDIKQRQEERKAIRVQLRNERLLAKKEEVKKYQDERKALIEQARQQRIDERNNRIEDLKKSKEKEQKLKEKTWLAKQEKKKKEIEIQNKEKIKLQKRHKRLIRVLKKRVNDLEEEVNTLKNKYES